MFKKNTLLVLIIFSSLLVAGGQKYIHHELNVTIFPDKNYLQVRDTISLPEQGAENPIFFLLHKDLKISGHDDSVKISRVKPGKKSSVRYHRFRLAFTKQKISTFNLKYEGRVHHPIAQLGEEYARGFSQTPGIISKKGIYLAGPSFWIPSFEKQLLTFKMQTRLPLGWNTVSQGSLLKSESQETVSVDIWDSPEPMEEIYLIGGKFFKFSRREGKVNIYAFLRSKDAPLANKYLKTTGQYLDMYQRLIGPYPYTKFALVENFWETGYGMPSFTLLGPKVIRFPFILHSSYPHELLHNYWGNGVFVDQDKGNWCEGLTAYLADHLIKEQRNAGREYRRDTLMGFTDYVNEGNDFPLVQFTSRTDAASSSIGYGKSMMLFHMLRKQVGDPLFKKSIRHFYMNNKFQQASFTDINESFNKVAGDNFDPFFQQWTFIKGAPRIRLSRVESKKKDQSYELTFHLAQVQKGKPFQLRIPVKIYCQELTEPIRKKFTLDTREKKFTLALPHPPVKMEVDPGFDLFRTLYPEEVPPSLSKAFGARKVLFVLPSSEKEEIKEAYLNFARGWAGKGKRQFRIVEDKEINELPQDHAVWIIGWKNKFRGHINQSVGQFKSSLDQQFFHVNKRKFSAKNKSLIICTRHPENLKSVVVLLSVDQTKALAGLARKLPHYGKYSYLGFEGAEPTNILKGQWQISESPLTKIWGENFDRTPYAESPEKPLARISSEFSPDKLIKHVHFLADEKLRGRAPGTPGIETAAQYIVGEFRRIRLRPGAGKNSFFQEWSQEIKGKQIRFRNIIGLIKGMNPEIAGKPVVICAHYDHLGVGGGTKKDEHFGKVFPGADDNASGVAVMLELAEYITKNQQPERSILFIAFTGEEMGLIGSKYFVNNFQRYSPKKLMAVVNLDTVGRLGKKPPMIFGSDTAKEWKFIFMGIEYTTGIKSVLATQNLDTSDQTSFSRIGVPGIHLFSGPHLDYHKPGDMVDKIDGPGMVKILTVAKETLVYLMNRKDPLTGLTGATTATKARRPGKQTRRASIGIMPDFSFKGKGVRAGMVIKKGPAEKAGLKKGDVITKIQGKEINTLREYSNLLKAFKPGDQVELEIKRGNKTFMVKLILKQR